MGLLRYEHFATLLEKCSNLNKVSFFNTAKKTGWQLRGVGEGGGCFKYVLPCTDINQIVNFSPLS